MPWRERTVAQPEQNPEIQLAQSIPPASGKRQPKWRQELYIWVLAILSAAIFLTVYVNTSSVGLGVLGFLIPSMFIVLWNMIIGPKKTSRHRKQAATTLRNSTPSNAVLRIEYFDGYSPIRTDGMETGLSEDKSLPDLIPWLQIVQAKVLSFQDVELMISTKIPPVSTFQLHLKLDEQMVAKDTVSAINTIVLAHKMSV
ncbi:hypothetical protein [Lysinibacillus sp. NPDC059133]|uniref:hypothetical protein n=1 Tax=Lysinibacillus sp. NPDC059133 TaxID=3346737 RepID=UPI00367D063A